MSATRADVIVPQGVWTNLYAASGISVGTQVEVRNKSTPFCKIAVSLLAPTSVDGYHLTAYPEADPIEIAPGEAGLWAYAPNGAVKLLVQEKSLEKSSNGSLWTSHIHPKGMDFDTAVGLNLVPGVRRVTALGNNPDIDQGTLPEDIWSFGGPYNWLTTSSSLEVVSSSTSDTSAGVGARTMLLQGLDANYLEVSQTITLNGTTPVAIPTQLFRVNSALIMSAGTTKVNVGNINVRVVGSGTVVAQIPVGYGISRQCVYTVPAAHTLSVHSILFAQTRSGGVDKNVTLATFFQSPNGFYRMPLEVSISQLAPYRHEGKPGIILTEKTDFTIRVLDSSASDASVTAAFLGTLYANTTLALV